MPDLGLFGGQWNLLAFSDGSRLQREINPR